MITGKEFKLSNNYDWTEEAIIIFGHLKCDVFLFVEEASRPPSILKISFNHAIAIRSARTDCSPGLKFKEETEKVEAGASCVLELFNSKWPEQALKSYTYGDFPFELSRHFVVESHDVFHEILADKYTENLIKSEDKEYVFAKSLFPDYLFEEG
jgi:hypothetical protein